MSPDPFTKITNLLYNLCNCLISVVNSALVNCLQCDLTDGGDVTATYTKQYKEPMLQRMSDAGVRYCIISFFGIITSLKIRIHTCISCT